MKGINTQKLTHAIMQVPGFRTGRKIVVFESDDWGSIRMPNKLVYDQLRQKIKGVDKL